MKASYNVLEDNPTQRGFVNGFGFPSGPITELARMINDYSLLVNLNHPLAPVRNGATAVSQPVQTGLVKVELVVFGKSFHLHLNGTPLEAFFHGKKRKDPCDGASEFLDAFGPHRGVSRLHPNLADALVKFQGFLPKELQRDEDGSFRTIYFRDGVFRGGPACPGDPEISPQADWVYLIRFNGRYWSVGREPRD